MVHKNIFGSRRNGSVVKGRFQAFRASDILAKEIERKADVQAQRNAKRIEKRRRSS